MGSRVFWAVIAGVAGGVCLRSFMALGYADAMFLLVLAGAAAALSVIEKNGALVVVAVVCVACTCGIVRMQLATIPDEPALAAALGRQVTIEGTIAGEPDARDTSTLIDVRTQTLAIDTSSAPVSAKLLALLPAHASVRYGDRVRVSGKLALPEAFDVGAGRSFDYPEYLAVRGISYELLFARVDVEEHGGNPIEAVAYSAKEWFLSGMRRALPEPESALGGGITVGDKRSIGSELSLVFQRDSLSHMIVLSGYNITVVLNAIAFLSRGAGRTAQLSGAMGVVALFALMSGGASSAMRAGLMALVAVTARVTHREYEGGRGLAIASFALVVWNPWMLVFDSSFQLSALATLGLILFTPIFSRWYMRVPERFGMREILASTCGTQLMVAPLLLYQSGTLSLVALPANMLALVPVPLAMFFSSVAALCGIAAPAIAPYVALPAYGLLWYIIAIARLFSSLPFAAVTVPAFSVWWLAGIYLGLMGMWVVAHKPT